MSALRHMLIGGLLLVVGWALIALVVLQVIPAGLLLAGFSYGLTLVGLALGLYGAFTYIRAGRG